jgi:hypothetical protein|tara:strand:- start:117 stop:311 length:195 start_codon:yes stop_codon:yes gene_type:complete
MGNAKNKAYYEDQGSAARHSEGCCYMPKPPYKGWQGKAWKKGWETAEDDLRAWFNFRWSRFHCM